MSILKKSWTNGSAATTSTVRTAQHKGKTPYEALREKLKSTNGMPQEQPHLTPDVLPSFRGASANISHTFPQDMLREGLPKPAAFLIFRRNL